MVTSEIVNSPFSFTERDNRMNLACEDRIGIGKRRDPGLVGCGT
jgi:hypothetical protein